MSKPRNLKLKNKVFGYLTIVKQIEVKKGRTRWLCRCKCGNFKDIVGDSITSGNVRSCGCLKKEKVLSGENHWNWKGDKVSYNALHDWVKWHLGYPTKCELCETTTAKKFEWANKSHKYKRELTDWMRLCAKCHDKYDNVQTKMWITRKANLEALL